MRILSLFDCPLEEIKGLVPIIKEQGFDAVQISPLQKTKDDSSKEWWMLYQPISMELGNKIGSKEELKQLCDVANSYGVYIIADVVVNHLAGSDNEGSLTPHPNCDKELLYNPDCWKEKKNMGPKDWDDRYKVTHYCMGLPGLNPRNEIVQRKVINMLNEYADLGVNGFRFDAAKSIALPEEFGENCRFFPNVTYSLKRWIPVIYGEVLFSDKELIGKYSKYMKVLTTGDSDDRDSIIRFVENKDSFLSGDVGKWTANWPVEKVVDDYANWLTPNYPNSLFYARNTYGRSSEDWHAWKSEKVRKANKVKVLK